ncbi:MAG: rRNA pseudouridine synthase [Clostridia bacterium]|nr:rRNA pseudouridine synthase [Clostridia bacterium]MBQ3127273.1 rRNA pseudouridine synthase [Clostridia bacterium]
MRLDKFLSSTGRLSRSQAARAARAGEITVNGAAVRAADMHIDPEADEITWRGEVLTFRRHVYVLLNKPDGYVSATEDGRERTVLELLPEELQRRGLFPCGRLDKHTLGLMLLTDNGSLAHRLLAPKTHVEKTYAFTLREPIDPDAARRLEKGVWLVDGAGERYLTKPCAIELCEDCTAGTVTLTEGKYHQVKRLFEEAGNKVVSLERITFAGLTLDGLPERGQWRFLTAEEEAALASHGAG